MARMTLSIIAQFQDRASRGLETLMRLGRQHERMQKAYGRASQDAARAQARLARASGEAGRAMGRESAAAARLHVALARVNAMIRKQASLRERLRRAGSLAREGGGRIGRAGAMAAGIYASVQATAASAASLVVGPAAQVEGYMVQLEALEGSAAKAKAAMGWIMQFASKTPLELNQVIDAYAQLRTFGLDPTNGTMQALVDTMAMSGKGAEHLQGIILAVGQAWTKGKLQGEEALQLIERGVPVWDLLSKAMGKPVPVIQKLASKGKLGRDVIAKLIQLMGQRAAGASEKFSRTWNGMVTNLMDMWFKFRLMVAQAGVFEFMKSKLQFLLETFNRLEASGKLQKIAQEIAASIIQGLKALWQFGLGVWAVLQKVGAALSWAAEKLGGWNNLTMVLMALPLVNVLASFVSGLMLLGQAMMMIMPIFAMLKAAAVALSPALALLATPVGMVVAGIAAIGAAIAGVIWYFDLWPAIVSTVSAAWEGLKQAGNALASFFSALPERISAAWQAFKQWLAQPFDPFPGLRQRVQAVITMLTALPQQAMAAISQVMAAIRGLDIGALINPVNWPGVIMQGLSTAVDSVRRAISSLGLADLIGRIDWGALLPTGLQSAISQVMAAIRGLDIGALINPVNWPGVVMQGLSTAVGSVRRAISSLGLADLIGRIDWGALLPTGLQSAISQVMAAIRGLDIGALINPVNWPALLMQGLQAAIDMVRQAFAGIDLFQAGLKALQSFWNGMKSVMKGLASWARRKLASIFTLPGWAKGWFGGSKQPAAQPQARASGGAFARGPLLVGERGPELIYASRAGWVAHNDNLRRLHDLAQRTAASLAAVGMAGHIMTGSAALAQPQITPISPSPAAIAAQPARAGQSGGRGETRIEVRYAPQITVHGNADAGQLRQALDAHLDDLLERLERRQRERARLEF